MTTWRLWGSLPSIRPPAPLAATDRVLVTGASSGLGAELAALYAAPARPLLLWGRDAERLETVARRCRAKGADVRLRRLDLADATSALAAIRADDVEMPVALAVLAAGLGDMRPDGAPTERAEQVLELGLVNFVAATVMATALAERMASRGTGHLVLIGSVAGFHALPFAATYCGSKAGLARFAQALRHAMRPYGVGVSLISPGFVDTPMSRRLDCEKPFLMAPETAARRIAAAVARNRAHLVLPWAATLLRAADLLPGWLVRAAIDRLRVSQQPRTYEAAPPCRR